MSRGKPRPDEPDPPAPGRLARQTLELLVVLLTGFLVVRAFVLEAYVVPTGSMAPTLLGEHREATCPNCRTVVVEGLDADGDPFPWLCPNCGRRDFSGAESVEAGGDRLLVQKSIFDWTRPARWEPIVFRGPTDPTQTFVKRVVGLPGESVQVAEGEVWVDGRVAQKPLDVARGMRILVYDHDHLPDDADRFPRWRTPSDSPGEGWDRRGSSLVGRKRPGADSLVDWAEYWHWDVVRERRGPIRDYCPDDGPDVGGDNTVFDVSTEAEVTAGPGATRLLVAVEAGAHRAEVLIPIGVDARVEVSVDGEPRGVAPGPTAIRADRPFHLGVDLVDRRLFVTVDGAILFEPLAIDEARHHGHPPSTESPIAFGLSEGSVTLDHIRVYRDVYYTSEPVGAPVRMQAVARPLSLGDGAYFVLGDNSPVSHDSRFWPDPPVVRADQLVGRPVVVHLPGRARPLTVGGKIRAWIPDPARIRYIR